MKERDWNSVHGNMSLSKVKIDVPIYFCMNYFLFAICIILHIFEAN